MSVAQTWRAGGRSVSTGLSTVYQAFVATLVAGLAGIIGFATDFDADAVETYSHGQESTVLSIVTVAAVAVVGTLIIGEIDAALPDPTQSNLSNANTDLIGGFGDAMGLLPVVFIVLVAALVIGVVRNFR